MNFYQYGAGNSFKTHIDGGYRDAALKSQSEFTFVLLLSDNFEGGATRFCHNNVPEWHGSPKQINGRLGRLLIFRQRDLKHCGSLVTSGTKSILQGMVMYSDNGLSSPPKSQFHTTSC